MTKHIYMEKPQEPREKQFADGSAADRKPPPPLIWDCGSSLYDSFELKSFERHLTSAISARTLSMPHLSDRRKMLPPPPPPKRSSSKISRSLQKLLKSVFRPIRQSTTQHEQSNNGIYTICDKSAGGELSEIPEYDRISPEIGPFVRRTASHLFKPALAGISCA